MKNYFLGLAAIIIAIGAAAYTSPEVKVKPQSYTFYFTGDPSSPGEVADESKWSITPTENDCGSTQNKACQIVVDDNQTFLDSGDGNKRKLLSTLGIIAAAGAGGSVSGYIPQMPHTGISLSVNRP
ncbi:MAG: hypothetical protein JNL51_10520 [Chitinophagaceae bacterium]|nr:hypothetical protein [Chitinophagaceae bacterium]